MPSLPFWTVLGILIVPQAPGVIGQDSRDRGNVAEAQSNRYEAISGEPFGVLVTEIPLQPGQDGTLPRILVSDADDRVFYPVVSVKTVEVVVDNQPRRDVRRPGGLIDRVRNALRGEPEKRQMPVAITVAALFRGNQPLELRLSGDINQRLRLKVTPHAPAAHSRAATNWWRMYVERAREDTAESDCPKLVHRYLLSMLARRMGFPTADLDPPDPNDKPQSEMLKTLSLLAGIESLREQTLENVLVNPGQSQGEEEYPLPDAPVWNQSQVPVIQHQVAIESIATRVPPECFYLRFGSFQNYVWFQDFSERFGGDIGQAVLMRGFNHEASARMERMLAAKMTTLAKLFGDRVIRDMAVVGSDLYLKEGASLGVIFHAANVGLLASSIDSDRKSVASGTTDASLSQLTIAGRNVSLLSTPDNRVRSFMVRDGDYLFITTSQHLATRFLQVADGDRALSTIPEFQLARTWMPDSQDYSIFAYLSPQFFHRLVSPQYQIELSRRLEAIAHLEIAEVASRAADAEGHPAMDLAALEQFGFLPPGFDERVDGARVIRIGDEWVDSLRGARGSFLPIADVQLVATSRFEAERYAAVSKYYVEKWRHMDPILIGLRRFQTPGETAETIAIEGYLAPFEPEKYGWIGKQLAAPTPIEIHQPASDKASIQLHVRGDAGLAQANADYYLFAGVKDMLPPDAEETKGLIKTLQALQATPAYLGAWPKPGIVEKLPLGLGIARPDAAGFTRMLAGLWRWEAGDFSVLSFDRSIIEEAIPQLAPVQSADVAQARLQVASLDGTLLAQWINRLWYQRGWQASHANTQLLDTVHQQLKVPQESCMQVTQSILDVKLQCPLGGAYEIQYSGDNSWWTSTAWSKGVLQSDGRYAPPEDYSAPWIQWFRGAKIHVTQQDDSLSVVGNIKLDMPPIDSTKFPTQPSVLPQLDFDIFQLPMKLFGGTASEQKSQSRGF